MTISTTVNPARKVPSVRELKDEIEAKRNLAKASGKILKNNVAMKEVARKYGFRTWEELHAVALRNAEAPSQAATQATPTLVILMIGTRPCLLILNRKVIAKQNAMFDRGNFEYLANDIADALGIKIEWVPFANEERRWDYEDIARELGYLDSLPPHIEHESDLPAFKISPQVIAKAIKVRGHRSSHGNGMTYERIVASDPNNDPIKGLINCMVQVHVDFPPFQTPTAHFQFFTISESFGLIEESPSRFGPQAKACADEIVKELNDIGFNINTITGSDPY